MNNEEIQQKGKQYVMYTYGRMPFALVRGQGTSVWDADGKRYLDMLGGIAVNVLGHSPPEVTGALKLQADLMVHCSNLYWVEPQVKLAEKLCRLSGLDKVFFSNSGAEANEAAIKAARKYSADRYGSGRSHILTMENSFHGRTLATLAATGQEKFHEDFLPLPEGFSHVPFNDWEAFREAAGENVCAVMIEPIQGEGGVHPVHREFLREVASYCREKDILLILDEIQCGIGRTGKFFACENYEVTPDIVTLAKGLGGGVPIGATIAREEVAAALGPGKHGSTFGGNPLACSAALAVVEKVARGGFLANVKAKGDYFAARLKELAAVHDSIREIRGRGLMLGLEVSFDCGQLVREAAQRGLLINCTDTNTLRFLPPLVVSKEEINDAVNIINDLLTEQDNGEEEDG